MKCEDYPLMTDLYQLTMAQGYWEAGKSDVEACFHMYFRMNPFKGGYAIACGMAELAEALETYHFSKENIDYLRSIPAPAGGALFSEEFLDYLKTFKFHLTIDAVEEGTVVFPYEPLLRITGSLMECQMLETLLLNIVNFETLIATKAARVCMSAQSSVAEFGLRRAQGLGGLWASRAAVVGGCSSTSNVEAGKKFGIPVSGTHAHSWVMAFDSELEAFRAYVKAFPHNAILLIDTYEVFQGLENAITVGLEMKERGEVLMGVRIDSGDLAWLSKKVRARLDEVGLFDTGIIVSNDLDEYTIKSIRDQGAPITGWGVGTKLACAYDQPSLGGVYKLSAIRNKGEKQWSDRLKISEQAIKLSFPGVLDIRRYRNEDNTFAADMVFDIYSEINEDEIMVDPMDSLRQKKLKGQEYECLLQPFMREGNLVLSEAQRNVKDAQKRVVSQLDCLDETRKRMLNPHSYPVGLERSLFNRRHEMLAQLRGVK